MWSVYWDGSTSISSGIVGEIPLKERVVRYKAFGRVFLIVVHPETEHTHEVSDILLK